MKVCPACGRRTEAEVDFCACGEYLGWVPAEPDAPRPTPPGTPTPAPPAAPSQAAQVPPVEVVRRPPAGHATAPGPGPGQRSRTQEQTAVRRPRDGGRAAGGPGGGTQAPTVLLGIYVSRTNRDAGVRAVTSVAAGGKSVLFAMIRNQSGIVDNYDLTIDGLPDGWWTTSPPTVYLVPLGRGEGFEQEVELVLHPPRTSAAEARPWTIHLIAKSRSSGLQVASAGATVAIEPYHELEAAILPPRADGRLGARFEAIVANRANATADVGVTIGDAEDDIDIEPDGRVATFKAVRAALSPFSGVLRKRASRMATHVRTPSSPASRAGMPRFGQRLVGKAVADQKRNAGRKLDDALAAAAGEHASTDRLGETVITIGPGESQSIRFVARPRSQLWLGRRTNRPFAVNARDLGAEARPIVRSATLRQKPWLPTWFMLLVALIIIAIIVVLQLRPKDVSVPNLVGVRSVFAAEQSLQHAGLVLTPGTQTKVDPKAPSGSVVGQAPTAGSRVRKGAPVSILVATRAGVASVPRIVGETLAQADAKLGKAGFTLGSVLPKPDSKQIVHSQVPAAGSRRKTGTPVNVFLGPRPPKPKKKTAGSTASSAAAGGGGGAAGGGKLKVPAFAGLALAAYQPKLATAGLAGKATYRIDPSPAGTVLATVPKPGATAAAHSAVAISVSAGFPLLAYDDGTNLAAVDGASGASSAALGIDQATEPAWDLTDGYLAFVRGPTILVRTPGRLLSVGPSGAGLTYDDPAFAPTHRAEVIASVSHTASTDSLCFSAIVSQRISAASCLPVPGWRLGQITWGHSGFSVLVSATASNDSTTFGLLQFFSATRFAAQASAWETAGTLVTPASPGRGVLQAAISPNGKQIAAIDNLGDGTFHVVLAGVRDLDLKAAMTLPTLGCDVAWRSDGGELAVVVGDPECASLAGSIVGFPPGDPQTPTTLVLKGQDPAWQPISVGRRP